MEENENKQETVKKVDVKEEAKAAKGFVVEIFKDPIGKIKEISNDTTNKNFKTTIVILAIWVVVLLISALDFDIFKYFTWKVLGNLILSYVKVILTPVLAVGAISTIILLMNKKSKKKFTTILSAITAAKLPIIAAKVISLLTLISSSAVIVTSKISSIASLISTVLMYFAIRELYGEEDEKMALKNFAIIEAIYILTSLIISYFGIYI